MMFASCTSQYSLIQVEAKTPHLLATSQFLTGYLQTLLTTIHFRLFLSQYFNTDSCIFALSHLGASSTSIDLSTAMSVVDE